MGSEIAVFIERMYSRPKINRLRKLLINDSCENLGYGGAGPANSSIHGC